MDISDRVNQVECDLAKLRANLLDYICQRPEEHPNPQWVEARLQALEENVKTLKTLLNRAEIDISDLTEVVLNRLSKLAGEFEQRIVALENRQKPEIYNEGT